jgi:hypothetical protein
LIIDPIQKFNEPLTIDPKEDFLIFGIVLRKFLITATENRGDVDPNLTIDQFWAHTEKIRS